MLLIPIGDENPKERVPYVNWALLAINIVVFFLAGFPQPSESVLANYALYPSHPSAWTMLTSMFLHANILHLLGNMVFLWIFGDNVEDKLGHVLYILFYLACGYSADLLHLVTSSAADIPTIGASGAISGVIGAYVVMFPQARVKLFIWVYFFVNVFLVRSVWWIGFWFLEQIVFGVADLNGRGGGVAYWAHIGGFVAGVVVAAFWKFVLFPAKFATEAGGVRQAAPERRTAAISYPDDDVQFMPETAETYAVLRTGPEVSQGAARIIAAETDEAPGSVAQRIRATRGMLARNIDQATASRIAAKLRAAGVATIVVPDTADHRPPIPFTPPQLAWSADGLTVVGVGGSVRIPWNAVSLVLAAHLGRGPVVDLFAGRRRIRVTPQTELRYVDAANRQFRATMNNFAAALGKVPTGASLNEGVGVLAAGGLWGWLAFPSEAEYEDYSFWVYNLSKK
jgi:membrane associated rhomboid family serine protease